MFRVILIAAALAALAFLCAWLSDNPGNVTLFWLNYRVDTSVTFLIVLAVSCFALVIGAIRLGVAVLTALGRIKPGNRYRNNTAAIEHLTQVLIAMASGDRAQARKKLASLKRSLGPAPVTLLLAAQLAKIEGNEADARTALEAMAEHRSTKFIASKGLSDYHLRHAEATSALPYAEQAFQLNPHDENTLRSFVVILLRLGRWQEALRAVKRARGISRADRKQMDAVIYTLHARTLAASRELTLASQFAAKAVKLVPTFAPFAAYAAELANQDGQHEAALKIIKKAWVLAPHRSLADAMIHIHADTPATLLLKAAQSLAKLHPGYEESRLLVARAALHAKSWESARRELHEVLAQRSSARACLLMAELEEAQYQDAQAAGRWRLKAAAAPEDERWVCHSCSHVSEEWLPECPSCRALDSARWERKGLQYAA